MTSASTQNTAGASIASLNETHVVEAPRSIAGMIWRRFRSHRMAMFGLVMLVVIIGYTILGSLAFTEDYANDVNLRTRWKPPSAEFPMGTDGVGRDVMARTVYGGQISLAISILAVSVTTVVGSTLGLIAGYYGGLLDNVIMRFAEALLSIPLLFLLLVLSKFIGGQMPEIQVLGRVLSGSVVVIIVVLGFTTWMGLTRLVRANVLSLKEQEFVVAARALGARNLGIIFRHILPNTLAPIIVTATLGICNVILAESYVSFLGLGVQPPTASWGNMLNQAMEKMDTVWWLWFFPGMFILLTVLSVNFIGDGLRDALDPYSTK